MVIPDHYSQRPQPTQAGLEVFYSRSDDLHGTRGYGQLDVRYPLRARGGSVNDIEPTYIFMVETDAGTTIQK